MFGKTKEQLEQYVVSLEHCRVGLPETVSPEHKARLIEIRDHFRFLMHLQEVQGRRN